MTIQEHFVGQFAYGLQEGIGIAFPAFAQDDAIRLIGARKLGTKIDLDFMFDKQLICEVVCCVDDCKVAMEK